MSHSRTGCQIHSVGTMGPPLKMREILWQRRNMVAHRIKRLLMRLRTYSNHLLMRNKSPAVSPKLASEPLKAGDIVRVRSRDEIEATLHNNALMGCAMMDDMWRYCGSSRRVFKRVEKFMDERDYLIKKCKGIVLLEGFHCSGTKDFGCCDRSCFFFWREEWLEKLE